MCCYNVTLSLCNLAIILHTKTEIKFRNNDRMKHRILLRERFAKEVFTWVTGLELKAGPYYGDHRCGGPLEIFD